MQLSQRWNKECGRNWYWELRVCSIVGAISAISSLCCTMPFVSTVVSTIAQKFRKAFIFDGRSLWTATARRSGELVYPSCVESHFKTRLIWIISYSCWWALRLLLWPVWIPKSPPAVMMATSWLLKEVGANMQLTFFFFFFLFFCIFVHWEWPS